MRGIGTSKGMIKKLSKGMGKKNLRDCLKKLEEKSTKKESFGKEAN